MSTHNVKKLEPADVQIVRITERDDPRVAQACEVLRQGFQNDPTMLCMVAGKDELRLRMHNAVVQASIIGGELWVALAARDYDGCLGLEVSGSESRSGGPTVRKGDVVGAASWYPSGTDFLDDDEQFQAGFAQLFDELEKTEPELHSWWFNVLFPKYESITSTLLAPLAPSPSPQTQTPTPTLTPTPADLGKSFKKSTYSLISFAVLPSLQTRGIGKQLLAIGERRARAAGVACCLETESDEQVAMYEYLGYRLLGSEFVEGPGETPGFREYVMIKTF